MGMETKKSSAFSQLATRAALGAMRWAMSGSGSRRGAWSLPGPREGEPFAEWGQRASGELVAMSAKARELGRGGGWAQAAAGLAKGVAAGYPLAIALGWCLARAGAAEGAPMQRLSGEGWELGLWRRGKALAASTERVRAARLDKGLPLPQLFGAGDGEVEPRWAERGKGMGLFALALPLAPLGWGAGMAALPGLRASGWRAVSEALARAARMMGAEDLAEGPPCAERVFEGWLDAAQWLGGMGEGPGGETLRALESYESTAGGKKLGLLRAPCLGWARMGSLPGGAGGEGAEARRRVEREAELSEASGFGLALWSLERSEGCGLAESDGDGPREMATLAARWWAAAGAGAGAAEPRRVAQRVGRAVADAFLEPGDWRAARGARWELMGVMGPTQGPGAAGLWGALELAARRARRQAMGEGWEPGLAREVAVELVAAGLGVAWARRRALASARQPAGDGGGEWTWTRSEALDFIGAEQERASVVAEAGGLGGAGLPAALERAMESAFSSGGGFFDALPRTEAKELLEGGFARWEAKSLGELGPAGPRAGGAARARL